MGREAHQNLKASVPPVVRRSARALLVDEQQRLVLIERTKPGQPVYWTAPGGGVEDGESAVTAVEREIVEELGATASVGGRVLLVSTPSGDGVAVQEVFVARLRTLREQDRTGAEWSDASRGGYAVARVPLDEVCEINLKPDVLREFVMANVDALLATAAELV